MHGHMNVKFFNTVVATLHRAVDSKSAWCKGLELLEITREAPKHSEGSRIFFPGSTLHGRQNFVQWRLKFGDPRYETCFVYPPDAYNFEVAPGFS
jgi:hypothetical protein